MGDKRPIVIVGNGEIASMAFEYFLLMIPTMNQ